MATPVVAFVRLTDTIAILINEDPTLGIVVTFTAFALDEDSHIVPLGVDEYGNPLALNFTGQVDLSASDDPVSLQGKIVTEVQTAFDDTSLPVTFLFDAVASSS